MNDYLLRHKELIENPTARVPICLVLDASPSMREGGSYDQPRPIDALNEGVRAFFQAIRSDEIALYAADVAIVSFAARPRIEFDFGSVEREVPTIAIHDNGGTSLGTGVEKGLELLNSRKAQYKETGVDYYQPWLVIMTDGEPTDESHRRVAPEVCRLIADRRLTIFPIGVGEGARLEILKEFSPQRPPLQLKGLCFPEFFQWLSRSVAATSRSTPGEVIKTDLDGIKAWAELSV